MTTAAIADIHGNLRALEAVLADPRCAAADRVVVLGDIVAGTFPAETFDLVASLGDRARILRGNADRIVLEGDGEESVWVRGLLGPGRCEAVGAWPVTFSIEVEGLGAVCCCHSTPTSDEELLTRITDEGDFATALDGTAEAVVIGGHTHVQFDRRIAGWRYVNAGSIGRPYEGRPGAYWALLGPDVELMRTDYDVDAAAQAVLASGQPRRQEVAETLLEPPSAEEATAYWEATRLCA